MYNLWILLCASGRHCKSHITKFYYPGSQNHKCCSWFPSCAHYEYINLDTYTCVQSNQNIVNVYNLHTEIDYQQNFDMIYSSHIRNYKQNYKRLRCTHFCILVFIFLWNKSFLLKYKCYIRYLILPIWSIWNVTTDHQTYHLI